MVATKENPWSRGSPVHAPIEKNFVELIPPLLASTLVHLADPHGEFAPCALDD
jgi:hypothetical protein